jgi:hypothetical protein
LNEAKSAGLATDTVESAALLEFMPKFWKTSAPFRYERPGNAMPVLFHYGRIISISRPGSCRRMTDISLPDA